MDTDLVVRAQHGDKEAYALIATEIADRFLAVARRILRATDHLLDRLPRRYERRSMRQPAAPALGCAADLAAAVSTAPGTELISGPSDVILGGRDAKHVVLTVHDRAGCDPGYFYSWPGECGGPCWMTTDPGDTIRVWIVDVDGTRLFIAGETHENAGAKLEQEIQGIVDSIQFE